MDAPRTADRLRRGITLLELLGVMLIFFIIWAFVFPAAERMVDNSRRRQASADVHAIATALVEYRRAYGVFPDATEEDTQNGGADIAYLVADGDAPHGVVPTRSDAVRAVDARRLLQVLRPCDPASPNTANPDNPRRIAFLEPDHARVRDDLLLDPWGAPYVAVVDANADGWIGSTDDDHSVSGFQVYEGSSPPRSHYVPGIREPVYVFSWTQTGIQSNRVSSAGGFR
jgi:type II secretory pathway pseudopilin PulG